MWGSLLDQLGAAAERAGAAAKELSKKGMEMAEAAAGEASKKLKEMGLAEEPAARPPPPPEDLLAYGITPEFAEFVRTLSYSTFRDFPPDQLPPLNQPGAGGEGSSGGGGGGGGGSGGGAAAVTLQPHALNPWQVRHATLVVRAVKEVDELRFVLCPKYLTDELFWHIYFTLVRKHLPEKAYSWCPGDALPATADDAAAAAAGGGGSFSLAGLGKQLQQIGSKLPARGTLAGLELSSLVAVRGSGGVCTSAGGAAAGAGAGPAHEAAPAAAGGGGGGAAAAPRKQEGLLENDPDLEAYLQVAINDAKESGDGEDEEGSGEELDLDSLMASLEEEEPAAPAAEKGGAAKGGGAGDGKQA